MNQESWDNLLSKKAPTGAIEPAGSKRISSPSTFFYKKFFPAIWFGLIGLFATFAIVSTATQSYLVPNGPPSAPSRNGAKSKSPPPIIVLLPLTFMAGLGYVLMRNLLWDLVDEVIDTGDAFIVRKGKLEERIPISNVINVSSQTYTNPPRLTLTLKQPGVFGKEFSFIIQQQRAIFSIKRDPLVDELIERVDAARRNLPPGVI